MTFLVCNCYINLSFLPLNKSGVNSSRNPVFHTFWRPHRMVHTFINSQLMDSRLRGNDISCLQHCFNLSFLYEQESSFFSNPQSATCNRQGSYPPSPLSSPRWVEEIFNLKLTILGDHIGSPPQIISLSLFSFAVCLLLVAVCFFPISNKQSPTGNAIINQQSATCNQQVSYPPSPLSSPRWVEEFFFNRQSTIGNRQGSY